MCRYSCGGEERIVRSWLSMALALMTLLAMAPEAAAALQNAPQGSTVGGRVF